MAKDPGERDDLAGRMKERAATMRSKLHAWRKSVDAAMPSPNPKYDRTREQQGLRWVPLE